MTLHKHFTSLLVVASLVAASTVIADTIASKIEAQGEMTYLKVTELRQTVRNGLLTIQVEVTNRHTGQVEIPAIQGYRLRLFIPDFPLLIPNREPYRTARWIIEINSNGGGATR